MVGFFSFPEWETSVVELLGKLWAHSCLGSANCRNEESHTSWRPEGHDCRLCPSIFFYFLTPVSFLLQVHCSISVFWLASWRGSQLNTETTLLLPVPFIWTCSSVGLSSSLLNVTVKFVPMSHHCQVTVLLRFRK
jgi:hypothetical protein